jgi:NitT/TauT family transport system ATP-binding protein
MMPDATRDVVISVREISKTYGTTKGGEVRAIDSITFDVKRGEFVSIVGRSGCGKSTLLKMISGYIMPSSGSVDVLGNKVIKPVSRLGQVFQRPTLMPWRNTLDNVMLPIELLHGDMKKSVPKATGLLEMMRLKGFEDLMPKELSLGMRHRASLARALIHDPDILIMDEPFGSLDELTREEIAAELLDITENLKKTVLFVTHSIPEAVMLGDRVIVLSERPSRVLEDVTIDIPRPRDLTVRAHPKLVAHSEHIRALLGLTRQPPN